MMTTGNVSAWSRASRHEQNVPPGLGCGGLEQAFGCAASLCRGDLLIPPRLHHLLANNNTMCSLKHTSVTKSNAAAACHYVASVRVADVLEGDVAMSG